MYRKSSDRRFNKNKLEIRRAYLDLAVEKGFHNITVSDIAVRADINRMTFYSHYDVVQDVFTEFLDDMEAEIGEELGKNSPDTVGARLFELLNTLMHREISFFRYAAIEGNCAEFRAGFRKTIRDLLALPVLENAFSAGTPASSEKSVALDLTAVCITYSYLDWLSGCYGDIPLETAVTVVKRMLGK